MYAKYKKRESNNFLTTLLIVREFQRTQSGVTLYSRPEQTQKTRPTDDREVI